MTSLPKPEKFVARSSEPFDTAFRIHFDNLPGPAYMWQRTPDGDFELIAYNRAAGALPFSKTGKYLGMRAQDLVAEVGHDLRIELEHCARTGTVLHKEVDHRYLGTDTVRRLAISLVPVSKDIVVLHTDDITEHAEIEAALRESEWKFRTIVDTAHEGILAVDHHGIVTYANRRIAAMLGYEADDIVGRSMFDFIDPSMHERVRRARMRRKGGVNEQFDLRLCHKDGCDVWVSVASSPQADEKGRVIGAIAMLSDISERKRTEQALQESEARYRALLQAIPDVILRVTADGRYIDLHYPDNLSDLPKPPREYIGKTVDEVHRDRPEFAREHERRRRRAIATGNVELWEYVRRRDGEDHHIEARFVSSGPDEVVITLRDITRRVELEREVITSTERERARIGHDLHDGLAQLLIGVKLLLKAHADRLETEGSPHHRDARRAASLMMDAVSQTGQLAQGLSPIRDGSRFGDALRRLAAQSEALLGVACEAAVDDAPRHLDQDTATHLYRIAQEAITNAVKHGKAKRLELECRHLGDRGALTIADDGLGIGDPCEVGGMGMHTMQYRARTIGGDLVIQRGSNGGTVVRCTFPLPPAGATRSTRVY